MDRSMRRWTCAWGRWGAALSLGIVILMLPVSAVSGGGQLTPDELLDGARAELSALLSPMSGRTDATVTQTIAELEAAAKEHVRLSTHYKTCMAAVTRVEKDSVKTSQQMHRIIDRTIARLERMGAAEEFIDQGNGLTVYSEYVESRPLHASQDIFESLGAAVGYVF